MKPGRLKSRNIIKAEGFDWINVRRFRSIACFQVRQCDRQANARANNNVDVSKYLEKSSATTSRERRYFIIIMKKRKRLSNVVVVYVSNRYFVFNSFYRISLVPLVT